MDAHFFGGTLCQPICWCCEKNKEATTYLSKLTLRKAWVVQVTTVPLVWRPDSELWKTSHPPDSFPSGLQSPLSSHSLGTNHPDCPLCLFFSFPFSFTICLPHSLSNFLFLSFSLSPCSLYSVLSRAPCVTRLIKTNTDPILVSNPIVLFFFSTALEHAEY